VEKVHQYQSSEQQKEILAGCVPGKTILDVAITARYLGSSRPGYATLMNLITLEKIELDLRSTVVKVCEDEWF